MRTDRVDVRVRESTCAGEPSAEVGSVEAHRSRGRADARGANWPDELRVDCALIFQGRSARAAARASCAALMRSSCAALMRSAA